jgi:hypothetical protein
MAAHRINPMASRRLPFIDHRAISSKGGFTTASRMTPEERTVAARKAAKARWKRYRAAKRALRKVQAA